MTGTIDGGGDTDLLDYTAYTSALGVNLGLSSTGLSATLGADQEKPPTTSTATGTATITNYNAVAKTFDISVTVDGLFPADVTGFHIHRAPVGVNGPIIIDFGSAGLVALPAPASPSMPRALPWTDGMRPLSWVASPTSMSTTLRSRAGPSAARSLPAAT